MNGIVYDSRRIMAYEGFYALGEYAEKDRGYALTDPDTYLKRLTEGRGMDRQ